MLFKAIDPILGVTMRAAFFDSLAAILALGWTVALADDLPISHRTCSETISFGQPLCDPGTVDVVAKPFDLYAKAKQVAVDPSLSGLPPTFTAYVYGFSDNPNEGWLAPPVFHVPQAYPEHRASLGTIRFDLHNMLPRVLDNTYMINNSIPAGDQPINIHTHGLIVLPHGADRDGAYGDFVGVLGCPETTVASCPRDPMSAAMTEVCGMAKSEAEGHACPNSSMGSRHHDHMMMPGTYHIHGHDVLLKPVPYAIEVSGTHPASLNWFHPHAHEISSPQVAAGLSGVLTVGSVCSDTNLSPASRTAVCPQTGGDPVPNATIAVRVLMLKDLQVFNDRQGGDGAGSAASAEGYRVIPTCTTPGLLSNGYCSFPADGATQIAGNWMFTVNGQIKPVVQMTQGVPEIWRIANVSSNATYRLSLCADAPVQDTATNPHLVTCADMKTFQILSLDGGRQPQGPVLTSETEVLLPPGARAEILLMPQAGEKLQLVQKGFEQPDLYPPVVLASASSQNGSTTAPNLIFTPFAAASIGNTQQEVEEPEDCEHKPDDLGVNDWVSLKGDENVVSVFFAKISNDPEILSLGLYNGNPETGDAQTQAHLQGCLSGGDPESFDCKNFKGGAFTMEHRNLCLRHGKQISFRLYNLTEETHNFHIHQQKFAVGDPGGIMSADPSIASALGSAIQRKLASGSPAADPSVSDPIVDSVPVPSIWVVDASGKKQARPAEVITMKFDRPEQVGDFVFHCHILEHEDKGMMKRITVYTRDLR